MYDNTRVPILRTHGFDIVDSYMKGLLNNVPWLNTQISGFYQDLRSCIFSSKYFVRLPCMLVNIFPISIV